MKKSIKIFLQKTVETSEGSLTGGFTSIKGGFTQFATVTTAGDNTRCTNESKCSGTTNTSNCTNSGVCDGSTNSGPGSGCSNSGTVCFS